MSRADFPVVVPGVQWRARAPLGSGMSIREAYLKDEARVYPDEWTAVELRAIADHMDKAPSAPAAGEVSK